MKAISLVDFGMEGMVYDVERCVYVCLLSLVSVMVKNHTTHNVDMVPHVRMYMWDMVR